MLGVSAIDPAADDASETREETSSESGSDGSSSNSSDSSVSHGTKERRRLSKLKSSQASIVRRNSTSFVVSVSKLKATKESLKSIDATVKAIGASSRKPRVTAERLAKMWGIGIDKARATIDAATQQEAIRDDVTKPFTRRLRTPHETCQEPSVRQLRERQDP